MALIPTQYLTQEMVAAVENCIEGLAKHCPSNGWAEQTFRIKVTPDGKLMLNIQYPKFKAKSKLKVAKS